MDDKIIFQRINSPILTEAATFTTFQEFTEFINTESATIINAPWSEAMAEAAATLPDNAETAEIISIVRETTTQGGATATGALALTGSSVASGGTGAYTAIGGLTSIGLTVAIAAGAAALGVAIGTVAGQKLYEANPELWGRISDAVLPACLKFESGSEPSQPQVAMVVGSNGKTYLPKSFMDLLKEALIEENMTSEDTFEPQIETTGTSTISVADLNSDPYKLADSIVSMASNISDFSNAISSTINNMVEMCVSNLHDAIGDNYIIAGALIDGSCTYPLDPTKTEWSLTFNLFVLEPNEYAKFDNLNINFIEQSPYSGSYISSGNYIEATSISGIIATVADAIVYINSNGEAEYWSEYGVTTSGIGNDFVSNHFQAWVEDANTLWATIKATNIGDWITNRPDGVSITEGSILPTTDVPLDITYPTWKPEWITVTKPPTSPDTEPDGEQPFIPVEIQPIDPEIGTESQDDSQSGDLSEIPQEFPIVTGLPEIIKIIIPSPTPTPDPNPDPLTEPIPEVDPVSPTEQPDAPVDPDTDPEPSWIPDPPYVPDPPVDPEPGTEPAPDPLPLPQPIPAPTNPPLPPVDDGTSPAIVLPPIDPNNGIGGVYKPSRSELRDLTRFLWSLAPIDQLKKFFQSPVEAIISLHQLYVTPTTGGDDNIYCGYIDTEVTAPVVTNQFVTLPCGSVAIPTKYNNALDYSPYTSVSIYLPFIGIRELNADDVIGSTITVTYNVDVLNGACLASVKCVRNNLNAVIYTFEGNCAVQLPVTGATFGGPTAGLMVAGAAIVGTLATGGAAATAIATGAGGMMAGSKTHVQKSGNFVGNAGALGSKTPYIIVTRPIPVTPVNYHMYYGLPSHVSVLISSLTGYTRAKSVHVDIASATDEEKQMIESILKNGFIA